MDWPTNHSYRTLSWLTGIPKSNLSAYRHGRLPVSPTIARRIEDAGRTDPNGPIVARHLLCFPQLALAVKRLMNVDEVHCTRLVRQTVQQLGELIDQADIAGFHIKPPTTGDARWNALIAGIAADTWARAGRGEPPAWTRHVRPLPGWWEPGGMPARWRNWNLVHTSPALRDRGVVFPRQWVEAV
jgi:hypothetical protein